MERVEVNMGKRQKSVDWTGEVEVGQDASRLFRGGEGSSTPAVAGGSVVHLVTYTHAYFELIFGLHCAVMRCKNICTPALCRTTKYN
jgi:hypothetical protein